MAYTKTTWQNNVTDIDANNLNKMEQGIYDNSLVVDAVTNKLNPTDTETYKTAELTEGQITDVIGVSDIVIKGDTEQDGTPTPSAPVDVNVVSGSNVVNTSNKNLLNLTDGTYTNNGVTAVVKNGKITLNGTAGTGNSLINISFLLKLPAQIQYTLSLNNNFTTSNTSDGLRLSTNDSTRGSFTALNRVKTFTYTEELADNNITIRLMAGSSVNNGTLKPMLEKASTATTYEPHQGKELPLDLPVENLFDISKYTRNNVDVEYDISKGSITITNKGSYARIEYSYAELVEMGLILGQKYMVSYDFTNNNNCSLQFRVYNSNNEVLSQSDVTTKKQGKIYHTFTFEDGKSIRFYTNTLSTSSTDSVILFNVQLEQGSKANAYTPYGTDPIELCKIGNYQDYFYKSGSKWYLHKEIIRTKLDGSESISTANTGTANWYYRVVPNVIKEVNSQTNQICNYYDNVEIFNSNITQGIMMVSDGAAIRIRYGTEDTVANFKTWLSNNNVILYCQLKNATDTEITDTTLISQLEAIYNAPLYEQTNITQTNNDLSMILDITACKDNINGIKAFIRK